jgi:hypothetical protein
MRTILGAVALFSLCSGIGSAGGPAGPERKIPLVIPPGAPLRVYLTRRISKRLGAPVEGKLIEPLYAFDRQVAPAGTKVLGHVSEVAPVARGQHFAAILNGDFTPLHVAKIQFTALVMPDGSQKPIDTVASVGSTSIFDPAAKKPKQPAKTTPKNGGVVASAESKVRDQIDSRIATVKSIPVMVRRPDKKEMLYDFVMMKLPYHPQYWRRGTRFDPELRAPLDFGSEEVPEAALSRLGSEPPADSVVHARLVTPLGSAASKLGEPVEAVLEQPLFTPDHKLVLPEGTRLDGAVVLARRARWLHRSGQLRFNFKDIELPPEVIAPPAGPMLVPGPKIPQRKLEIRTEATLQAAESSGKTPVQVDSEGGVKAKDSKRRFIAPAISFWIANRAGDTDAGHMHQGVAQGPNANVGGRTIGGGAGFGLLGAAVSQSSVYVGMAFGYYGLAWSVYSNVLERGGEVEFEKNSSIDVRFNTRAPAGASKFRGD